MKKLITLLALAFCLNVGAQTCAPGITIMPNDTICSGQTATITASGTTSYTWIPTGANTSSITTTPVNTTNVPISVVYTLTASTGTCTVIDTISVIVLPNPKAGFSFAECTCIGTNATGFHDTTHAIAGDTIIKWHWTFSGQGYYTTSTIKNPGEDPANGSDTVCLMVTTKHGCISSTCIVIANYTESIKDMKNTLSASVFPNPANTIINVELKMKDMGNAQCILYDINGKAVKQSIIYNDPKGIPQSLIDVSDLNEGVYNISLISNEGVVNKRVVIVR